MNGTLGCPVCGTSNIAFGATACPRCGVAFASPIVAPHVMAAPAHATVATATVAAAPGAAVLSAPTTAHGASAGSTATHPLTDERAQYGSIWRRMGAGIIDSLLLGLPFLLYVGPSTYFGDDAQDSGWSWVFPTSGWEIAEAAAWFTYVVVMLTSSWQATVGMRMLHLRVVRDETREPLTGGRAIARELATFLSGIILMLGYLMIAFTKKRQALHDMIAGTVVLHDRR